MWGALHIGAAVLTIGMAAHLTPRLEHSGMTLVVRFPDGKKTKLPIEGTPAAPMVKGSAEVEYRGGRSRIKVTLENLPDPRRVGAFSTTYVAWVVRGDEGVENLGEVSVKKHAVVASTPARTLGLIITAEPYGSVRLPSSLVVAELTLPQTADLQLQTSTVTYEGVAADFTGRVCRMLQVSHPIL